MTITDFVFAIGGLTFLSGLGYTFVSDPSRSERVVAVALMCLGTITMILASVAVIKNF